MSTITLTIWTRQRSRAGLEVGGGSGGEESGEYYTIDCLLQALNG